MFYAEKIYLAEFKVVVFFIYRGKCISEVFDMTVVKNFIGNLIGAVFEIYPCDKN
jgi:hypothetical protein